MFQKISITLFCAALFSFATGPASSADQIYRWVDDQGVVHFGQIVPAGVEATPVGVRPNTVTSVSPPPVKATTDSATEEAAPAGETESISYAEQRRRDRAERAQEQARHNQQLARECKLMRQQLAVLEPSPRVMIRGEDGTVQRLDDDKRVQTLNETRAFIAENCKD